MNRQNRLGPLLKPRQLQIFMMVVQEKNMARAAERLAISRPVVSKAIAYLERSLSVVLLDRTARGVEPTVFGNALSKRGAALFDELRSTAEELSYLADPATGELRIASTEVWAAGLIPAAIEQLRSKFPRLRLRLEQGTAQSQFDLLRGRSSELVVSRLLTASPDPDIDCEPLFYEKLIVVAGPQSSWARQKRLRLKNLVEAQWILSPLELEKNSPFTLAFRGAGLPVPIPQVLSNSLHLRNGLLSEGEYITLVPESALHFGPERMLLRPLRLEFPRWNVPTGIFWLKGRMLSPIAQQFMAVVRRMTKGLSKQA
jgi:DNA-binding transcriptional LysR family regulator